MGCKKDTLMIADPPLDKPWITNLKKTGITAATASIGLIDMWDLSSGKFNDHIHNKTTDFVVLFEEFLCFSFLLQKNHIF